MALCCIGGVCVPYTAVVPILLMGLKWFIGKLAEYGLLPDSVVQYLGLQGIQQTCGKRSCTPSGTTGTPSCCTGAAKAPAPPNAGEEVMVLETVDQFNALLQTNETMVIKFTASWCRPCQAIGPVYKELATIYAAHFIEVDVDDFDQIASQYKVAVMPTFCIVKGGHEATIDTLTGSNEQSLRLFMDTSLTKRCDMSNDR